MGIVRYIQVPSPVGRLLLAGDGERLRWVLFAGGPRPARPEPGWRPDRHPFRETIRQLEAYFAGELTQFRLPLALAGTPFQLAVWEALRGIPYGETISYGELARRAGRPRAPRAAGAANGQNPLSIVVPCHRVVGSTGGLTGYGGGLRAKAFLLALERGRGSRRRARPRTGDAASSSDDPPVRDPPTGLGS